MKPLKRDVHKLLRRLYADESSYDVVFKIRTEDGNTDDVPAHKLIMASTSDVFRAMFFGPLAAKEPEIFLEDIEAAGFHNLIKYSYGIDVVLKSIDEAIATVFCSKKYLVMELQDFCLEHLYQHTEIDQAFTVFVASVLLDSTRLEQKSVKLIKDHFEIIEEYGLAKTDFAKSFFTLSPEHMKLLVKEISPQLNHVWLFNFINRWCQKQLDQNSIETLLIRHYFEPFLPHIHFLKMSHKDYVTQVVPSNVLKLEEVAAIGINLECQGKLKGPLPTWCNPICTIDYAFHMNNNNKNPSNKRTVKGSDGLKLPNFSVSHDAYLCAIKFDVSWNMEEFKSALFTARLEVNNCLEEEFVIRSGKDEPAATKHTYGYGYEPHINMVETKVEIYPAKEVLLKISNRYALTIKYETICSSQQCYFLDYGSPNILYQFQAGQKNRFKVNFHDAKRSKYIELHFRVPFDGTAN